LTPAVLETLRRHKFEVLIEHGAGQAAGFPDGAYEAKGARVTSRDGVFAAEAVVRVRAFQSGGERNRADFERLRPGQFLIGMFDALWRSRQEMEELAAAGVTSLALDLMPRISRAQAMDVLSSMATIAGYKAALLAAAHLHKMLPMLMTAAGTIPPARVLVIGAGVAGLQAIATARRLGAVVEAYDVRPAVKEQVQSLGARFLELPLEAGEDSSGYAQAQDEAFQQRQRELMARAVASSDAVITTASVPGRRAPLLITAGMVERMQPGSVIVDLAAEHGGNCELTRPDETVAAHGVIILGPTNLPATVPYDASQMYARNLTAFLLHLAPEGALRLDAEDVILRETMLTREGEVVHPRLRQRVRLAAD